MWECQNSLLGVINFKQSLYMLQTGYGTWETTMYNGNDSFYLSGTYDSNVVLWLECQVSIWKNKG